MDRLSRIFALIGAWLARGNEAGVTTRRLNTICVVANQALVVALVAFADTDRATRLIEPLLIFIAAALGLYIAGRTMQVATGPGRVAPAPATPATPAAPATPATPAAPATPERPA